MIQVPIYFAPINSLGNVAFRKVCLDSGASFVFTEMVMVEKLMDGVKYQFNKLNIPKEERDKTIVQIICEDIANISKGVDIVMKECTFVKEINYNMGCPQASLCKNERGGAIIKNAEKVKEVAEKLKKSCDKYNVVPSIKIRLGYKRDSINIIENVENIRNAGINKIYIHGRCLKESYLIPASYTEIQEVKLKFPELVIFANGDIKDFDSLDRIVKETNCDGVLVGRAALKNPFIFKELKFKGDFKIIKTDISEERGKAIKEFLKYAVKYDISIDRIKNNINYMTKDITNGAEFRHQLNNIKTIKEIVKLVTDFKE